MLSASDIAIFVQQTTSEAIARVVEFVQSASADRERVDDAKDLLAEAMTSPMDLSLGADQFARIAAYDVMSSALATAFPPLE